MSEEQSVGQSGGPEPIPPPPGPAGSGSAPGSGGERPGPPQNIQQLVASKRLQQAQAQVGEVVDIMRVNVEKVCKRQQNLTFLNISTKTLRALLGEGGGPKNVYRILT